MQLDDNLAEPAAIAALGDGVTCWKLGADRPPLFIAALEGAFESAAATAAWVNEKRPVLDALIVEHGGIVLRDFPVATTEDFAQISDCFPAYTGGYQGGAAARRAVGKGVYEATQRAAEQRIPIHQEMFYLRDYPLRIAFFAKKVAEEGGETVIADMRGVTGSLPGPVREKLESIGIRNVRNFADKTGSHEETRAMDKRGWDFAFYTDSREEVEEVCRRRHMRPHWHDNGSLTVFNDENAFEVHPVSGERIYRGGVQLAAFYRGEYDPSGTTAEVQAGQKFPSGSYYGDGSEMTVDEEAAMQAVIDRFTYSWQWHDGDIMILDNLKTGHGRAPYVGTRATEVALLN